MLRSLPIVGPGRSILFSGQRRDSQHDVQISLARPNVPSRPALVALSFGGLLTAAAIGFAVLITARPRLHRWKLHQERCTPLSCCHAAMLPCTPLSKARPLLGVAE